MMPFLLHASLGVAQWREMVACRFIMHQLSDKIRLQEQADADQEAKDSDEQDAKLAEQTVEKHWGGRHKASSKKIAVVGDEADAAADQYEQRQVSGLTLLVVGAGEMVGELALGFKEPDNTAPIDPADAARKLVDEVKTKRFAPVGKSSRKQLHRSNSAPRPTQSRSVRLCLLYARQAGACLLACAVIASC